MPVALQQVELTVFRTRNFIFLAAIIALNYTLMRPSPVDLMFILAFLVSLFVKQEMTTRFVILLVLLTSWATAYFLASIPFLGEPDVGFELRHALVRKNVVVERRLRPRLRVTSSHVPRPEVESIVDLGRTCPFVC